MTDPWTNFKKLKVVGRGAHGLAILCKERKENTLVVVKELFGTNMTKSQEALNEIQVLSIVRHPNIIAYYDSFTAEVKEAFEIDDEDEDEEEKDEKGNLNKKKNNSPELIELLGQPDGHQQLARKKTLGKKNNVQLTLYIVMEYADGGTLDAYLATLTELLPEPEILYLFSQIALAMAHVHSHNILHRDLKTNNIMISGSGPNKILKIGDFGISKLLSSETKAETVVGTPSYLSPELCEGKPYNEKSDIWAIGCILYELVCNKKMFEASNLPAIVLKIMKGQYTPIPSDYSNDLRKLIDSCVQLDPSARPSTKSIMGLVFLQSSLLEAQFTIGRLTKTDEPTFV